MYEAGEQVNALVRRETTRESIAKLIGVNPDGALGSRITDRVMRSAEERPKWWECNEEWNQTCAEQCMV